MIEIHGEFEETYSVISIDGYIVPNIKCYKRDGIVDISLDNRFLITVKDGPEINQWVYLLANAMAIAAGYSCFGENSVPTNQYRTRILGISLSNMNNLQNEGEK